MKKVRWLGKAKEKSSSGEKDIQKMHREAQHFCGKNGGQPQQRKSALTRKTTQGEINTSKNEFTIQSGTEQNSIPLSRRPSSRCESTKKEKKKK